MISQVEPIAYKRGVHRCRRLFNKEIIPFLTAVFEILREIEAKGLTLSGEQNSSMRGGGLG